MNKIFSRLIVLAICLLSGSMAKGDNLFKTLLGKTDSEVQEHMNNLWEHFFTPGDLSLYEADGQRSVYYETADGMAFIMDTGNNDVRTEGMSYGMMISVQLNHREQFDKLWNWSKKHMAYGADTPWDGYFCWQCDTNGKHIGQSNASDGELYFVTALLLASERWNAPEYAEQANAILDKIMNKDGEKTGVYNLFNKDNYLITFVPDKGGHYFTDPSYMLPAFLDKWAKSVKNNRAFWQKAAKAARQHLIDSAHPETGVYPDYSEYNGKPYRWPHAGYDTSIYMWDALRCPMNVGMDYYLCGKDKKRQEQVMRNWLTFIKKDGFKHSHFGWEGSNAHGDYNHGMMGANAVGAIALAKSSSAADRELAREYVQQLWDAAPPTGKYRYYEGLVFFLSQLHVSGNFSLKF